MDRRSFLKSLAALGAALAVPLEALAKLPKVEIDQAWQAAVQQPFTFWVNEYGSLSTAPEVFPPNRASLLLLEPVRSHGELLRLMDEQPRVAEYIALHQFKYEEGADDEEPAVTYARFESADDATIASGIEWANDWLEGWPDERDIEEANLRGYSDRGAALRFFRDEFENNDLFDIVVVEGDCPGSSYFAAELRMPIDQANELAEAHGIPIRFAADI